MNGHGRAYEHELATELDYLTPDEVWVSTVGYSGNSAIGASDVVVTVDPKLRLTHEPAQYNIEAKKRRGESGNRISNVFAGSETTETGLEELWRFHEDTPEWAESVVVVNFDHRKPLVASTTWLLAYLDELDIHIPNFVEDTLLPRVEPRLTDSDNISMKKPTLDEWSSAQASDSAAQMLCEFCDFPWREDETDG